MQTPVASSRVAQDIRNEQCANLVCQLQHQGLSIFQQFFKTIFYSKMNWSGFGPNLVLCTAGKPRASFHVPPDETRSLPREGFLKLSWTTDQRRSSNTMHPITGWVRWHSAVASRGAPRSCEEALLEALGNFQQDSTQQKWSI